MLKRFKVLLVCLLAMAAQSALAQQNPIKGLDLFMNAGANAGTKSFASVAPGNSPGGLYVTTESFDFLTQPAGRYSFQVNQGTLFGDEFVMGMKFTDRFSVRLNLMDGDDPKWSMFMVPAEQQRDSSGLAGYQLGVSSVFDLGDQWRLGFELGQGQLKGEYLGLYQDDMNRTSLGLGVRYNQFGATVNSDFFSRDSNDLLEQSTLDLKVDWHFTKDGTISIGARKGVKENGNSVDSVLDQLNGTVPYIKFKHNL